MLIKAVLHVHKADLFSATVKLQRELTCKLPKDSSVQHFWLLIIKPVEVKKFYLKGVFIFLFSSRVNTRTIIPDQFYNHIDSPNSKLASFYNFETLLYRNTRQGKSGENVFSGINSVVGQF